MRSPNDPGVPVARTTVESPIGPLTLLASDRGLSSALFVGERGGPAACLAGVPEDAEHPVLRRARAELRKYFERTLRAFDVPLDLAGTPFQLRVWAELQRIGYGKTVSYGELARRIGCGPGARAVGGANARNPVSIIVPCHRVVGARGELTGFGGGLARKRFLLDLESDGGAALEGAAQRP